MFTYNVDLTVFEVMQARFSCEKGGVILLQNILSAIVRLLVSVKFRHGPVMKSIIFTAYNTGKCKTRLPNYVTL